MAVEFLGYGVWPDLAEFMRWHGDCTNPGLGTVCQVLGFNEKGATKNYTKPLPHPDANYQLTANNWPIGTSTTTETRVYAAIDSDCPHALQPQTLFTYEEVDGMGFIPGFYETQAQSFWSRLTNWFTG